MSCVYAEGFVMGSFWCDWCGQEFGFRKRQFTIVSRVGKEYFCSKKCTDNRKKDIIALETIEKEME